MVLNFYQASSQGGLWQSPGEVEGDARFWDNLGKSKLQEILHLIETMTVQAQFLFRLLFPGSTVALLSAPDNDDAFPNG